MKRRALLTALLFLLLLPGPGLSARPDAGDVKVSAKVDVAAIGESDSVTLSIEVRGSSLPAIEEPDLSGLADFTIASGPNVSSSTSMIWDGGGAKVSAVKQYTYVLLPRRKGSLGIPPVRVRVGSQSFLTQKLDVEVTDAPQAPPRGGRRGQRVPFDQVFGGSQEEPLTGEIFVDAAVDRSEAYVGEQVLVVYKLYSQVDLAALPQPKELPDFTGFWVEELPLDPRSTLKRTVLRGKEYIELTLMKKALFPTKSGDLGIDEIVFEVQVRQRSNDPFDAFFNRSRAVYKKSPALKLKALPLPERGRPAAFNGAVGEFKLAVSADRQEAQVNEAVGLSVAVEGDGSLQSLGQPVLPELPEYRLFDPKVEDETSVVGDRIRGKRTWSYVLVPLSPGDRPIPPVRFAYFDPRAAQYRELSGSPILVSVKRGAGGSALAEGAGAVRRDVVAMRRDILYIKPAASLTESGGWLGGGPWFYILAALPIAGNVALYLHVRRQDHLSANAGLFRRRRASKMARERLRAARRLVGSGDAAAFHAELHRAVTGYVADKFNVSAAGVTRERIEEMLAATRVGPGLRREVTGILEACDYGRFAPGGAGVERLEGLLGRAEDLLASLERHLA